MEVKQKYKNTKLRNKKMKNILNLKNGSLVIYADGYYEFDSVHKENGFNLDYHYDKNAKCSNWMKFLNNTLDEHDSIKLMKFIAYCLIPGHNPFILQDMREKALLLFGRGNGKTTITNIIKKLLGENSYSDLNTNEFNAFEIDNLKSKIVNIGLIENPVTHSQLLKIKLLISNNEKVYVNQKAKEPYFMNTHEKPKLIFISSQKTSKELGEDIYRRMLKINFKKELLNEEMDKKLEEKLTNELSGILNYVLLRLKNIDNSSKSNL